MDAHQCIPMPILFEIMLIDISKYPYLIAQILFLTPRNNSIASAVCAENSDRLNAVQWPPEPIEMRNIWVFYYRECERIAKQLLKTVSIILKLENENYFDSYIKLSIN